MKKKLSLVLCVVLIAAVFTGCGRSAINSMAGAAKDDYYYDGGSSWQSADFAAPAAMAEEAAWYDDYDYDYEAAYAPEPEPAQLSSSANSNSEIPPDRNGVKMIYSAYVEMESTTFEEAMEAVNTLTESCGGYFEASSMSDRGSTRSATYTVRVPADQYRTFLRTAGTLCHVTYQEESSQDVSETYYDTAGRLTTQQTKLARLQELLAEASHMDDIIVLENEISDTEEMIDRLSGTLRRYDALVSYSTIDITLREVKVYTEVPVVTETFASRMGTAFRSGLRSIGDALADLAVALAYCWLWIVIIAAIVVIVLLATKKKRQERREKKKNAPPVTVPGYSRPEPQNDGSQN